MLLQPQADERGLTFEAALPARGVLVTADRERIRQVLVNLTSNAIKYNRPNGAVTLQADADRSAACARQHQRHGPRHS